VGAEPEARHAPEVAAAAAQRPEQVGVLVGRVLAKLGVRSRAEAAAHAVREGI
jgi:DNA-binding CsgD family transcriptional regulator